MKLLLTILIVSAGLTVSSQALFMAYKLNGKISQLKKGKKIPVKIGSVLNENDSVFLEQGASAKFICNNYSLIDLVTINASSLKPLATKCNPSSNSGDAVYFSYIWEQLSHQHEDPEENRKKFMNNVGGAIRGCPGIKFEDYLDTVRFYSAGFFLRWKLLSGVDSVSLAFYQGEDNEMPVAVFKAETDSFDISGLQQKNILPGGYYWTVLMNGREYCPKKYIELFSKTEFDNLTAELWKNTDTTAGKAEQFYRIGFYLEREHFYSEAFKFYNEAFKEEPQNELYENTVKVVKKLYHL